MTPRIGDDIAVMISFDDPYILPAAALVSSILAHARDREQLTFHLLYHGTRRSVTARFDRLVHAAGASRVWLRHEDVELALLREIYLGATTHYPPSAYSRLMITELLPETVDKVIYLDADTLLRRDIADLWHVEMGDNVMLAARDPLIAIDAPMRALGIAPAPGREELGTLRYGDYLARIVREMNSDAYAFSEDDPYFQSGVLVLNLTAMREEKIAPTLIAFMRDHGHLAYPDQDALNIVLRGRIGALDPTWNVTGTVFHDETAAKIPFADGALRQLQDAPGLVHFTLRPKPWQYGCRHPFLPDWYEAIDSSPWRGWRATRVRSFLQRIPRARRLIGKKLRTGTRQGV